MKWFSSDWHLSHKNIIEYSNRPFKSIEEMDNTIIENMFTPLKKGDELFFLGDMSWSKDTYRRVFDVIPKNISFHWIIGNHELNKWKRWRTNVTSTSELRHIKIQGNTVALCHYPMFTWNKSHYNSWMLYGHHHAGKDTSTDKVQQYLRGKMLNVNCEFHDYKPWSETEIIEYMSAQPDNWDYIGG